jgi:hypothetical protein
MDLKSGINRRIQQVFNSYWRNESSDETGGTSNRFEDLRMHASFRKSWREEHILEI